MARKKYLHTLGFLGTGVVARSFLVRMKALRDLLGPVYSPTKRATPRLVTALGAGYPVPTIEEASGCRQLLLCASPDDTLTLLQHALEAGTLDRVDLLILADRSSDVVLPDDVVRTVTESGCIVQLPIRREPTYLVEGSIRFRRFCQTLTKAPLRRLVLSRRESRGVMEAALFMAEEFCLPLFEAVQNAIAQSGVSHEYARQLTAELLSESVHNAHFAGRKRWTGILHTEDGVKLARILQSLQEENELLANLVLNYAQHGLAVMGKRTEWLENAASSNGQTPMLIGPKGPQE
jgi:hypothetical protein